MGPRPSEGAGYRERTLTAEDGLRLYFRDYGPRRGAGPAVLCLGGLTRNSKDFHDLARKLCRDRRVLCPDYRGRGRSAYDPDWRHYRVPTYVNDIRHLLAATNVHKVVVVGTSLGGLLAMALSAAMPMALAGAVLNDIGPEIEAAGLKRILAYVADDRPMADWPAAARHLRETLPNLPFADDAAWLKFARATYREDPDGRLRFDWDPNLIRPFRSARNDDADLWPLFRGLRRVPVLAVRGGASDVLSQPTFERMALEKPDLMRLTVPGVGHVPLLTEPKVLDAIYALLDRV